jgi:hypothetical protein
VPAVSSSSHSVLSQQPLRLRAGGWATNGRLLRTPLRTRGAPTTRRAGADRALPRPVPPAQTRGTRDGLTPNRQLELAPPRRFHTNYVCMRGNDSDDVLVEDDIKARLLIWNAVIDDVCKSQTATVLSSEKLRFAAWFRALYQGVVGGAVLPKSKCWICQSDGHLAATCSTAKGKELREKKLSSAVKPAAEAK